MLHWTLFLLCLQPQGVGDVPPSIDSSHYTLKLGEWKQGESVAEGGIVASHV